MKMTIFRSKSRCLGGDLARATARGTHAGAMHGGPGLGEGRARAAGALPGDGLGRLQSKMCRRRPRG